LEEAVAAGMPVGVRRERVGANWGGNHRYRAERLHRPETLEDVQAIVAGAPRVRVLGSRHSFNDIADSTELLSLDGLAADVVVDSAAGTATFGAGLRYGELAEALNREGLALHALASVPHISVGGAVATATHGSGDATGNLATAVAALELVRSDGEVLTVSREDPDFDGMVVGLGALGAVTRITLDVQPAYHVRQRVFEGLPWDALYAHFDAITASADSVSIFTRWGETTDQVWCKTRVSDEPEAVREDLFGALASTVDRHPLLGTDPDQCTPQLGVPGLWSERLGHFRAGVLPGEGAELQSEYFVARAHAIDAIEAVRSLAGHIRPVAELCEIRTVAADRLWMSPQYECDTVALHFTWKPGQEAVERVLGLVEPALAPFAARPHWGKLFLADAARIRPLYARTPAFLRLAERLDPRGAFRNRWLERCLLED
jgi:xylitol oxidase